MAIKKIIIVATTALLGGLMIWANMADGSAEKTTDGATGQPTNLQKDLPSEEKIPSH